ncbi:MAG: tetratricopeptide repeat protein, partial [Bryobacterales bacterium]|nr:tetratricopeptide repeat protein [Bryobacterales bacterium]
IRTQLWLKQWHAAQAFSDWLAPKNISDGEWRGLEFFKDLTVPDGDPRLNLVYANFRENALNIVRTAQKSGGRVILSTVAVNLRDFPPFSSPDGAASRAYAAGDFARARDLDQLRFRADSRINAIIREVAAQTSTELVDAEQAIEPTRRYFWEHVHLRPEGNAKLALLVARKIHPDAPPPSIEVSGWDEHRLYRDMKALVSRPPFLAAHLAAIGDASSEANWQKARDVWRQRTLEWPEDFIAVERLAELEAATANPRGAEESYRKLTAKMPLRIWQTGLAEALLQQGKFAEAEHAYESALAIDKRFAPAWLGLGVVRAAAGDAAQAEAAMRKALALRPGMAQAHNSLARLLQSAGKLAEAEQHYRSAIERQPDLAVARYGRAGVLARLQREPEAIAELREAVKHDPALAAAHYDLGLLLARRGSFDEAETHYSEALRLDPRNADAWNNWGTALARQGKQAEARKKFESALAADPKHSAARRNLELLPAR